MAQQQREENSVLFSLKELRQLEDDRIRKEDDEVRAREASERQAREDAERQARENAERLARETEERARKLQEDAQARERDEQFRLAESERRARVEGEMRLQQERMHLELQSRKHRSPWKTVAVAVGVVVVIFAGVFWKLAADNRAQVEAQRSERIKFEMEANRRELEQRRKYEALVEERRKALVTARSDEERQRIQRDIEEEREKERSRRARTTPRVSPSPAASRPSAPPTIRKPRDIDDDPLKGLKL